MEDQEPKKSADLLEAEALATRLADVCRPHDMMVTLAAALMFVSAIVETMVETSPPPPGIAQDLQRLLLMTCTVAEYCRAGLQTREPTRPN